MPKKFFKYLFLAVIAVVVVGFFLTFEGYKSNPAKEKATLSSEQLKSIEDAGKNPENLKILGDNIKPASQNIDPTKLSAIDIKIGTGEEVKNGDKAYVHYIGSLLSGKKFDSSLDRNQPFSFTVGAGRVIQGWEKGILGMKVGGKRKLFIPPQLGYGAQGVPGTIPSNSVLVFEIELVKIISNRE